MIHKNFKYRWWTGWRAVICGESFNIYKITTGLYHIGLPNGELAIVSDKLPESITS